MITPRRTRLVRTAGLHGFREAIAALARDLDARPARDTVVLVPTRAAADQLRRTLEEPAHLTTPAPALPALLTREDWYQALSARADPPATLLSAVERYVLMLAAVRTAAAEASAPPFKPRPGLVPSIVQFYDELRRRRQTVDSFERLVGADLEASADLDRGARRLLQQTRFLAAAFRAFEQRSADTGRYDEHSLRQRLISGGPGRPIVAVVATLADQAAESDGLWPADFDLLTRIAGLERIDVVATDAVLAAGFHERLADHLPGIDEERFDAPVAAPLLVAPGDSEHVHFVRRDREEELLEVARALQPASPAAGAAVVFQRPLPYLYLARQLFPQAGVPFQTRDAFPLAAEPYAAALGLVIEFVQTGFSRAAAVALLRSPHYCFEHAGRPLAAREVDALDRALHRVRFGGGQRALSALAAHWGGSGADSGGYDPRLAEAAPAAAVAAALAAELQPLESAGPPSAQIELLAAFLRRYRTAAAAPAPAAERERRARDAVLEVLAALARTHAAFDDAPLGFDDLTASVRRWIESRTFQPLIGSGGAHLVDARAAVYGRFETVFIVGLVDDDWPPPPNRVVFYPPPLLRALGWPPERDRLQAARARFSDLVRLAAGRVSFSAFSLEDDAVVIPSMFLEQLADSGLSIARESPATRSPVVPDDVLMGSPPPADLPQAGREWLALRQQRPRPDDRYRGAAGASRLGTYPAGAVEQYLDCPFKYFARYELGLEEEPAGETTLSPRTRGALLRRLMKRFFAVWQAEGELAITLANQDRALDRFRALVDEEVRDAPPADRAVVRTWLLGSAAAPGLAEQLCLVELGRSTEVVERLVDLRVEETCALSPDEGARRVRVRGSVDRVDLLADGTFSAIDYRAGRAPGGERASQLWARTRWAERQLDGYRGRTWRARDAAYVALADPRLHVPLANGPVEPALTEGATRARKVLALIARGAYPVRPSGRHLCTSCAYAAVCRKDYSEEA